MPASQLKQLKASLRDQGLVGQQRSKKEKARSRQHGMPQDRRIARDTALNGLRERFNPFDAKHPARPEKHQALGKDGKPPLARPGVTKAREEQARHHAVRAERLQRLKDGGMVDRRFGENNPTMTPEERALERFVREKQRSYRKQAVFNLEDDSDDGGGLTHLGQSLALDDEEVGDELGGDEVEAEANQRGGKRRRLSDADEEGTERPKSKKEVMEEVIAKSKLHKYERQKEKEDDDDLRDQLDAELEDIKNLLWHPQAASTNKPEQDSNAHAQQDKEYDERVRQLTLEARAKPTIRTKTDEELASEEAVRLKSLEESRLKRMQPGEDEELEAFADRNGFQQEGDDDDVNGLGPGLGPAQISNQALGVEDEDAFVLDPDLIASGSELACQESNGVSGSEDDQEDQESDQDSHASEDSFIDPTMPNGHSDFKSNSKSLGFTYPCPHSHQELLQITGSTSIDDLPTIIQRIRILYSPKLEDGNKSKLARFSAVLVDHLAFLPNQAERPPFSVLEALIRHIHSLAKTFPEDVGRAFRAQLEIIHYSRSSALNAGDLMILTAIGSIFSTSDHFHQVGTPAMLTMARYLGLTPPKTLAHLARGVYVGTLCLQYQRLSKRYLPEVVNYVLQSLSMLSPVKPKRPSGGYPIHDTDEALRIQKNSALQDGPRRLHFWDIEYVSSEDDAADEKVKLALLQTNISLIETMSQLWKDQPASIEIFQPFEHALAHLATPACSKLLPYPITSAIATTLTHIRTLLQAARHQRPPLALHHHKPLPIKSSIPRFEASFDPDKHYDPDRERAQSQKLKAEHRKERKAVLKDFRKDAAFTAREQLREKKERDAAYDKKFRRLVAEIQGEEGREARAYEKEKRMRKTKR